MTTAASVTRGQTTTSAPASKASFIPQAPKYALAVKGFLEYSCKEFPFSIFARGSSASFNSSILGMRSSPSIYATFKLRLNS